MLRFEKIQPEAVHIDILYDLLASRKHGISHRSMPSYAEHETFVRNHPYRAWFLIRDGEHPIGTVYLQTDNSIGVHIAEERLADCLAPVLDWVLTSFEPLPAVKSVRAGGFSIHVAPDDKALIGALESRGLRVAQITYALGR